VLHFKLELALDEMLTDIGSGSAGRMYTTINKQIRKAVGITKNMVLNELTATQANEIAEYRHNVDTQIMYMIENDYESRQIRNNIKEFLNPDKPKSDKKRRKEWEALGTVSGADIKGGA